MKKFILVLRGPSGAGKTTLSKSIQEKIGSKVAHLRADYFYWKVCPQDENKNIDNNPIVYKNLADLTRNYLEDGYSVILDGLLTKIDAFDLDNELMKLSKEFDSKYVRVFLEVDLEDALTRNSVEKSFVEESDIKKWIEESALSVIEKDALIRTTGKDLSQIKKLIFKSIR